jgi:uncharacterized protein YkwD
LPGRLFRPIGLGMEPKMSKIWMICGAAIVAALLGLAPASASASGPYDNLLAPESACPGQSDPSLPAAAQEQTMVCMHNWARAQSGLQPMVMARQLQRSSHKKARDIRRCHQFSHNACGRSPFYWIHRVGFETGHYGAGENLAFGQGSAGTVRSMMSAWLNSAVHRSDLLTPSWRDVGVSLLDGKLDGHSGVAIWVAHFGYHGH